MTLDEVFDSDPPSELLYIHRRGRGSQWVLCKHKIENEYWVNVLQEMAQSIKEYPNI